MLQNAQLDQAKTLLQVLANQNYAPALTDLATVLLMEAKDKNDAVEVVRLLKKAEQQDFAAAIYMLCAISLSDGIELLDWQQLSARFQKCYSLNNAHALCNAAIFLARYGSAQEQSDSTQLLELSAMQGNITAMALLGERLASGFCCTANPARANSIRQIALSLELPVPAPDPTFGFAPAEPSAAPRALEHAPIFDWQKTLQFEQGIELDDRIQAKLHQSFFSDEECLYIRCLGGANLKPSISVDPNGTRHQNHIRTSHDFQFLPENEEMYLKLLQCRMAAAARLPLKNAEPLILLRYMPGQEYKPHRDYLPPSHFIATEQGGAGQRLRTVIAYLNTPALGGATLFPLLGKEIPALQGQLLLFDNIHASQKLNELSLHAGAPVERGAKWITTLWIRQNTMRLL